MPKIKAFKPQRQLDIEDALRRRYRGMMTLSDVCEELGFSAHSRRSACRWLEGIPCQTVNGYKRWRTADIAAKMYMEEAV